MGLWLRATMLAIVLATLPASSSGIIEARTAVSTYSDRATFLAAAGATTTIDFSTNDSAVPITNPPSDVSFNLFARSGAIFQDIHSYFDQFIYTFPKAVIRVNLPPGTTTVATDIAPFNQGAGTYTITLSTGDTFQLSNNGSVQFFGAVATTSIQWVDFSLNRASMMLDNFAFGAGPSQGWNATSPMPTSRFAAGAVRLQSGKVLVVGGHSFINDGFITEADVYDPAGGDWTITTPLPLAHRLSATLLNTGEVLVVGDDEFGTATPSAYLYNEASAAWTPTKPPSLVRYAPVVTVLPSGVVLMAGGYDGHCCTGPTGTFNTAELYDRSSNSWTLTAAMAETRTAHTATLLTSGKVLVTGGLIRDSITARSSAEIYDPVTQTWLPTGSMATPRFSHTATLLPSGKVLVSGGHHSTFSIALASAEIYDPASGVWSPTTPMSVARGNHTATLLPSGAVLVAGGENDGDELDSSEIYDPASGGWSNGGRMINKRQRHTATLLTSGLVLLAGGVAGGSDIASAEFWTPASSPQPLTPQQALGNLNYAVLTLVARETLNDSEADGPISKLQAAITKLNKGNTHAACKQLKKFVNQVNALVTAGTLTPNVGQDLIDATLRVKDTIGC